MRYSEQEHKHWFNTQPRKPMSAAVLFTNGADEVLLVKPNYRDDWNLPGGVVDEHESPLAAAVREVQEELSLTLSPESLQFSSVDYRPAANGLTDKLYFYFLGGALEPARTEKIQLQESELEDMRFASLGAARQLLSKWTHRQVSFALKEELSSRYLEQGAPTFTGSL